MTRDYAKHGRQPFPVVATLSGIAIGCGIALLATVFLTPLPQNEQRLIRNPSPAPADGEVVVNREAKPSLPPKEPARFKFYELLPNLEIIPFSDPTAAPTAQKPARPEPARPEPEPARPEPRPQATAAPQRPASGESYWVQAGSFRNAEDAEARRVHLILLGFAPKVEVADIPGKGVFHRVKIGPQADTAKAKDVMRRLAEDGIDSYFTREKG